MNGISLRERRKSRAERMGERARLSIRVNNQPTIFVVELQRYAGLTVHTESALAPCTKERNDNTHTHPSLSQHRMGIQCELCSSPETLVLTIHSGNALSASFAHACTLQLFRSHRRPATPPSFGVHTKYLCSH